MINDNYLRIEEWLTQTKISITEEEILNFLKIKKRWPKEFYHQNICSSIAIINYFGWNTNLIYRDGMLFDGNGYLDYDKFINYYNQGFSFMLIDILDLTDELRNIQSFFELEFGTSVKGNLYINGNLTSGNNSFDNHQHDYDVFVKQLYGSADWLVNNSSLSLTQNDTICIPKFTNHSVTKRSKKRASLTIDLI